MATRSLSLTDDEQAVIEAYRTLRAARLAAVAAEATVEANRRDATDKADAHAAALEEFRRIAR